MGTIRKGILVLDPRTKILLLLGINIFVFTNSHVCAEMLVVAIRVGNNIKDLGEGVFANCENLRYVVLGDSVKTIGCDPFLNTNIQEVTLNDGLQKIGEDDINNTVDAPSKNIGMDLKIPESVTEMHLRDFHLIVKAGSYAEQYAKEYAESNNLTYTVE